MRDRGTAALIVVRPGSGEGAGADRVPSHLFGGREGE